MSQDNESPETEASLDEGEDKKGNKKLIIIIVGILALLTATGVGLYFTGMLDGLLGKKEATEEHAEEGGEAAHEEGHAEEKKPAKKDDHGGKPAAKGGDGHGGAALSGFVPIPDMIVNLSTSDGSSRFLRLKVQLELEDPADQPAIEAVMPRVVDQFQTYLREMRVEDLRGSKGLYRLQLELLSRVNKAAAPVVVKDVLFQEILIQ